MPVKVTESLKLPDMPTPAHENPIDASPNEARYVIMHTLVDTHEYLSVVRADDLGDVATRQRLLNLGAIAPLNDAITYFAMSGEIATANRLREQK